MDQEQGLRRGTGRRETTPGCRSLRSGIGFTWVGEGLDVPGQVYVGGGPSEGKDGLNLRKLTHIQNNKRRGR